MWKKKEVIHIWNADVSSCFILKLWMNCGKVLKGRQEKALTGVIV